MKIEETLNLDALPLLIVYSTILTLRSIPRSVGILWCLAIGFRPHTSRAGSLFMVRDVINCLRM